MARSSLLSSEANIAKNGEIIFCGYSFGSSGDSSLHGGRRSRGHFAASHQTVSGVGHEGNCQGICIVHGPVDSLLTPISNQYL